MLEEKSRLTRAPPDALSPWQSSRVGRGGAGGNQSLRMPRRVWFKHETVGERGLFNGHFS